VNNPNTEAACKVGLGLLLYRKEPKRSEDWLRGGLEIFDRLGSRALGYHRDLEKARKILKRFDEARRNSKRPRAK
jgi:hypothetical protein